MDKQSGIYIILCKPTGENYVGSAVNLLRRIREHKYDLNRGIHANSKLLAEWERYTEDAFEFSVLELVADKTKLLEREQFWIDTLRPTLNIAQSVIAPALGLKRSDVTKERLRRATERQHARMTVEQKEARRQKVSAGWQSWWNGLTDEERDAARKRRSHGQSEATKEILRQKTLANPSRAMLGKHPSPDTLEKMRLATQSRWDETKIERDAEKARLNSEFEAGRAGREMERRRKLSEANTGKALSGATKDKLRAVALSQQQDPEYRAKQQAAVQEKMQDPEVYARMIAGQQAALARKGGKLSAEHRAAIGAATKGKKRSEETKRKQSEARKTFWAKRKAQKSE